MNNGWEALMGILPPWLRRETGEKTSLQEIRLRLGQPVELVLKGDHIWLDRNIQQGDMDFCINAASRYSPWNQASASKGYLTAPGGHRIGICGEMVFRDGQPSGFRKIRSLCIRVARDVGDIARISPEQIGSVLIIGAPGWGKTTLLRDLIRQVSKSRTVAVVDERGELFPEGFRQGKQTDILTGCPKAQGILQLLRTMGPQGIAVDEITEEEDCRALTQASRCGVFLMATAHAGSLADLKQREVYRPLLPLFDTVWCMRADQSYEMERMIK